jgi:hypothetical protein
MKHIFTVHSPITFLCAYSVCKTLELNEADVIIISSGYTPPFEYGQIVPAFHEKKNGFLSKLLNINLPKAYDKYISNLIDRNDFIAYIDLMHYWQRILVTHENCKQFNFLEEGMNSYLKPDTLGEVTFVAKEKTFRVNSMKDYLNLFYFAARGYNHKLLNLPYWSLGYRYLENVSYFCFSDLCYPGIKREYKKVIKFHSNSDNGLKLENAIIWIEDIYNKRHVSDNKDIHFAFDNSVKYIQNEYGMTHKHYVKLRPSGKVSESEVAPILAENEIDYEILNVNEPLELILSKSKNIVLISATSSLCYYGKTMGHEAYTYFWLLKNRRHSAFEGMDFYWNLVNKIPWFNEK